MIYLYRRGTRLGRIARRLGISVCYPYEKKNNTRIRSKPAREAINWGCVKLKDHVAMDRRILNYDISSAQSKVRAFELLEKTSILVPRWDKDYNKLKARVGSKTIIGRRDYLSGGRGICRLGDSGFSKSHFYVERISYQREFRAHVFCGEVIAEQRKMLPKGCDNFIHTFENGVTFSEGNFDDWTDQAKAIRSMAVGAVAAVGLDFGAVDFILNKKGRLYVLEVNSAPGIRADAIESAWEKTLAKWHTR